MPLAEEELSTGDASIVDVARTGGVAGVGGHVLTEPDTAATARFWNWFCSHGVAPTPAPNGLNWLKSEWRAEPRQLFDDRNTRIIGASLTGTPLATGFVRRVCWTRGNGIVDRFLQQLLLGGQPHLQLPRDAAEPSPLH